MALMSMMGRARKMSMALCVPAVLAVSAAVTQAATKNIDYTIAQGTNNNFAFSYIHSADSYTTIDGVKYFNGGQLLFELGGTLTTTFDDVTGVSTLRNGPVDLTAKVRSEASTNSMTSSFVDALDVDDIWTLRILSLNITDDVLTPAVADSANGAHGTMQYELIDDNNIMLTNGTYHFFDKAFVGSTNNLQEDGSGPIALWGNNWDNTIPASKPALHLGIDLGGIIGSNVVVPVPMAVWGGLSVLGAMGLVRIKQRSGGKIL